MLDQLTGATVPGTGFGRLRLMLGASHFVTLPDGGIRFLFKGSRKYNGVQLDLLPSDTYRMTLYRIGLSGRNIGRVTSEKKIEGLYFDKLPEVFKDHTGLETVPPRFAGVERARPSMGRRRSRSF